MRRIASPHELRDFPGLLTRRQLQIAQHVVAGHTARYIARELCLSPRTVETHIENMRHKLGCANRTELVVCFLQADMHRSSRAGQS
ncbi:response regulator transcription factor [Streptomyces rimosus]